METRGGEYRALIEYFLLMQGGTKDDKLVYYDQNGTKYEKQVERDKVDEALRYFDGTLKTVARSTGGMARAIPFQLVMFDPSSESGTSQPEVRIQVKFRDFKRDSLGKIIPNEYVTRTKTVLPSELGEALPQRLEGEQRFVLDLGQGLIPIYVFRYATDEAGHTQALFVELDDLEQVLLGKKGKQVHIQAYQVPRDLLRVARAGSETRKDEFDAAVDNYQDLKAKGVEIVPATMQVGQKIRCPESISYQDFRRFLSRSLKKQQIESLEIPTKTDIKAPEKITDVTTKELVPFGIFELTE